MISTVIDQSLGLEFPIFQGGMAWVADASLAAGVSNAGGLGIIAAMNSNGEQLREEIRKCKTMTDKIFGVNIMLMSPFAEEVSDVVVEEGIKVITTGAGNPGKYMAKWLEAGIKVIPVVPSVALARKMEKDGAFAVIAEGGESGGHVGDLTTMALVPQVVDAVNIPVIAAAENLCTIVQIFHIRLVNVVDELYAFSAVRFKPEKTLGIGVIRNLIAVFVNVGILSAENTGSKIKCTARNAAPADPLDRFRQIKILRLIGVLRR